MNSQQSPWGQPDPPFRSTSIDDLVESTTQSPLPPPELPAQPLTRAEERKAARQAKARTERRAGAPMWFVFGLGLILVGGMVSLDAVGPSFERDGRITDRDTSRGRRGSINYSIEGVDDRGGTFKMDVTKDEYEDASRGSVVVTRSSITGRVVGVRGSGLDIGGFKLMTYFFLAMAVVGIALMAWSVRTMRHLATEAGKENPRSLSRGVRWGSAAVVAAFLIWVFYERSTANMGGEQVRSFTTPATEASTVPPTCNVVINDPMLNVSMADGLVSATDVSLLIGLATAPGCSRDTVVTLVCEGIEAALATRPDVALQAGTSCR